MSSDICNFILLGAISAATNALLLVVLGFLFRSLILHLLSKNIESYKAILEKELESFKIKLQHDKDREIEMLRKDLEMKALEHEIRFSKLHDRRAVIIAEFYAKFIEAYYSAGEFLNSIGYEGQPSKEKLGEKTYKQIREMDRYFNLNRLYFDEALCGKIGDVIEGIFDPTIKFILALQEEKETGGEHRAINEWIISLKAYQEKVPEIKRLIEDEFRKILGVKSS
ncbi:MAG: hypothetical protein A2V67_03165 [Deltaproteobacteria bacterium RBG_13_61_14]|nr:MAG: hypothetical protein A2V67_03165 [Deltaproteobacteria bacterium RBG_13_61_14]